MGTKRAPRIASRRAQRGVMLMLLLLLFAIPIIMAAYIGLVLKPGLQLVQNRMSQHQADYAALSLSWECAQIPECRKVGQGSALLPDWPASLARHARESVFEQAALSVLQILTLSNSAHAQGSKCEPPDCFTGTALPAGDGKTKIRVVDSNPDIDLKAAAEAIAEQGGGGDACVHARNTDNIKTINLGQTGGSGEGVSLKTVNCDIVLNSSRNQNALFIGPGSSLIAESDSSSQDQEEQEPKIRVAGTGAGRVSSPLANATPDPIYNDDTIDASCLEEFDMDDVDFDEDETVDGDLEICNNSASDQAAVYEDTDNDQIVFYRNLYVDGDLTIDGESTVVFDVKATDENRIIYVTGNLYVGKNPSCGDDENGSDSQGQGGDGSGNQGQVGGAANEGGGSDSSPTLETHGVTEENPLAFYVGGDFHIYDSPDIDFEFYGELSADEIDIRNQARVTVKHARKHGYRCMSGTSEKPFIVK